MNDIKLKMRITEFITRKIVASSQKERDFFEEIALYLMELEELRQEIKDLREENIELKKNEIKKIMDEIFSIQDSDIKIVKEKDNVKPIKRKRNGDV